MFKDCFVLFCFSNFTNIIDSSALGNGYRCGFLGVLHLEVFTQRLEQEFGVSVLNTSPSVPYRCKHNENDGFSISNYINSNYER